ncbi:FCD domain-containing protein [Nodosilinea sp. AN01ver1]|uniref:FCD domain-containing protein n=1 Tax=Nodosilinea sp. AN01ver1 TaxID=3423362 RepID=UPI003D30F36D
MILSQKAPSRSSSLYEQTYLALRSAILSGDIAADERLIETQLADQLEVSRTPVREAIRRLQQESLIQVDSDGGLYIVKLSLKDAIKLYDCRIALERLAVLEACEHATPHHLQKIEQNLVLAEAAAKASPSAQGNPTVDSIRLLELSCEFHQLIAKSSGNSWIVSLLDQISQKITLIRVQTLKGLDQLIDIDTEHRQIYEAIARRDSAAAEQQMVNHLRSSQARIVEVFKQAELATQASFNSRTKCPRCGSFEISRNGRRAGRQNYLCKACGRQFLEYGIFPNG